MQKKAVSLSGILKSLAKPRIPFMGVLISWLILEWNADF